MDWDKEDTKQMNSAFVGNWHKEADEQNAQIYFTMSIDAFAKIRICTTNGGNLKVLADQLRSAADKLEKQDSNTLVLKFPLN